MARFAPALLLGFALVGLGCGRPATAGVPHVALDARAKLLPARTRRLSNWELERSVAAFTGVEVTLAAELPPDVRQEGYTRNAAQDVSTPGPHATRRWLRPSRPMRRARWPRASPALTSARPRAASAR